MPYPGSTYEQQWREARDNAPFILVPVHSGHTPGPWYCHFAACIEEQGTGDYVDATGICTAREEEFMQDGGRGDLVAFVPHDGPHQANTSLIAAAPDLLTALIAMRNEFTSNGCDGQHNACRMADAAIKKAGGE